MKLIGGVLGGGCYDDHEIGLRSGHFADDVVAVVAGDVAGDGRRRRRST